MMLCGEFKAHTGQLWPRGSPGACRHQVFAMSSPPLGDRLPGCTFYRGKLRLPEKPPARSVTAEQVLENLKRGWADGISTL
jgi:hypothetical protein